MCLLLGAHRADWWRGCRAHNLHLSSLCEKALKIVQLLFENLILRPQGSVVEFEFVVFFDYFVVLALEVLLLCLFLLSRANGSFSVFAFLHSCDGVQRALGEVCTEATVFVATTELEVVNTVLVTVIVCGKAWLVWPWVLELPIDF